MDTETIINKHSKLIYRMANRLYRNNKLYSKQDLIQVGFLAICKSAHKYDSSRGKITTFVTHCARNDMIKFIQANRLNQELAYEESVRFTYNQDDEVSLLNSDSSDFLSLKNETERQIINMKMCGFSNRHIASKLNINANKISDILCDIKERLLKENV